jgi:hypothetical protein
VRVPVVFASLLGLLSVAEAAELDEPTLALQPPTIATPTSARSDMEMKRFRKSDRSTS